MKDLLGSCRRVSLWTAESVDSVCLNQPPHSPLNLQAIQTISTVKLSGKRLLQLINDILDAAKMKQGILVIKHENVRGPTIIISSLASKPPSSSPFPLHDTPSLHGTWHRLTSSGWSQMFWTFHCRWLGKVCALSTTLAPSPRLSVIPAASYKSYITSLGTQVRRDVHTSS